MNLRQILKLQVKARKQQDKEFKRLYKKAVSTIRRLKEDKQTKQPLIDDLLNCNNIEIIHYLGSITPKTKAEYIKDVNSLLEYESVAYEYQQKMVYDVGAKGTKIVIDGLLCYSGGFGALTEKIRKQHKVIDRYNRLKEAVFRTNISEG